MSSVGRLFMDLSSSLIYGEAADEEFRGQIELDSWDWDLTRCRDQVKKAAAGQASTSDRERVEPSVFRFTKHMDRSSMQMLQRLTSKKAMVVKVTLVENSDCPFKLVVELKEAHVINYSVTGKDEEKRGEVEETWTFNYQELAFIHSPEPMKGSPEKIDSLPMVRPAGADTEKSDSVKEFVAKFKTLSLNEKKDAAGQIKPLDGKWYE